MERSQGDIRSARGRSARRRGVDFERRLCRDFRAAGFAARRVFEWDQGQGRDIDLGVPVRPGDFSAVVWFTNTDVAIQAKNTQTPSDLHKGLLEAITKNRYAKAWICIHNHKRTRRIRWQWSGKPYEDIEWPELMKRLWSLAPLYPRRDLRPGTSTSPSSGSSPPPSTPTSEPSGSTSPLPPP